MSGGVMIEFPELVKAIFLVRPNRFIVRCALYPSGEEVEAHLADPGRLKELLVTGAEIYLRPVNSPKRKTKWSACLVKAPDGITLVSLQSLLANQLTAKALQQNALSELQGWKVDRAEFTYGNSRWDFYLKDSKQRRLLLEVKSCTLVQDSIAMFPDAVTARGKRHVQELTELQLGAKFKTAILFVIQRNDAKSFRTARHIDPAFAEALAIAFNQGVKVIAYNSLIEIKGIRLGCNVPIDLS